MARPWGLGPVFAYEWLTSSRRWQVYAARSLFVATLLAGLTVVWWGEVRHRPVTTIQGQARAAELFTHALVTIQLALVLLAAPAATAGAICVDKARGTLAHVLATDLSDAEIVLGKLAARVAPVLGLIAGTLPVMAISTLLGGIDPVRITGALLVVVGVAVLGCSLALALSVWGTKTHEVLLVTYSLLVAWLLTAPIWSAIQGNFGGGWTPPAWVVWSNPFALAFGAPDQRIPITLGHQAGFLGAAGMLSVVLVGLATVRIRSVVARQAGRGARPRKGRLGPLEGAAARVSGCDGLPVHHRVEAGLAIGRRTSQGLRGQDGGIPDSRGHSVRASLRVRGLPCGPERIEAPSPSGLFGSRREAHGSTLSPWERVAARPPGEGAQAAGRCENRTAPPSPSPRGPDDPTLLGSGCGGEFFSLPPCGHRFGHNFSTRQAGSTGSLLMNRRPGRDVGIRSLAI